MKFESTVQHESQKRWLADKPPKGSLQSAIKEYGD